MAAAATRSGRRSGSRRRHAGCFLNTARIDGRDFNKGKRRCMNLCRPWPQGRRSGGVAEVAHHVCYGGAYGRLPSPRSVFHRIPTLRVRARSREALLRKTRTSPSWPRRGRRGLRRRRGSFSNGGNISYGGQGRCRIAKFVLLSSPGFKAPARTVGKYGREAERRPRNSHKEGTVIDCG